MALRIDKDTATVLREEITEALEKALKPFGLEPKLGRIVYTAVTLRTQLSVQAIGHDPYAAEYERRGRSWPLKPLGSTIVLDGEPYTIEGWDSKAKKYPLIVQNCSTGDRVRCTERKAWRLVEHLVETRS